MRAIEEIILYRIKKRGLTQTKISELLGKDISQISREMKCMRTGKNLRGDTINKYLKIL